jgi:hypothetical protein
MSLDELVVKIANALEGPPRCMICDELLLNFNVSTSLYIYYFKWNHCQYLLDGKVTKDEPEEDELFPAVWCRSKLYRLGDIDDLMTLVVDALKRARYSDASIAEFKRGV